MNDMESQFSALKQATNSDVAAAIERLVRDAEDHELNRINALDFAAKNALNEERVISGFLHASRLGLFDLTWNVLCPGCSGVLDAHGTLKSLRTDDYHCALCGCGYEASVDEQVEVAFTVAPRVRRIAAHDPNALPIWQYFKQVFWSSGVDFDAASFASLSDEIVLDARELPAHQKTELILQLPQQFIIVFEPVTHAAQFIDVQGEATDELQHLTLTYKGDHASTLTTTLRPGPLQLALDNQTGVRVLPSVLVAADALHHLIGKRKPFLTAKRMLTNQTFRDIYKADNLDIDQRLKITSLTFLFTDLKGSTALYERVGDLAAFDLVRAHFHALLEIISSEAGAGGKDHRRCRDGDLRTAGAGARRGIAHACRNAETQRAAWHHRSGGQDRYPRGAVPRGDAERAAGLLRPDGEHCRARPGAVHVAGHPRHRVGEIGARGGGHPAARGDYADREARGFARHHRQDRGLRNPLTLPNFNAVTATATARRACIFAPEARNQLAENWDD